MESLICNRVYAQEPNEDTVYLKDGSRLRGTIIDIRKDIMTFRKKDGILIKINSSQVIKFSSDRPFKEIYKQADEEEIKKPGRSGKREQGLFGLGLNLAYAGIESTKTDFSGVPISFDPDKNWGLGLNLTYYFNHIFSLEFSAEYFKTDVDIDITGLSSNIVDLTQYSYLITGRFHLPLKTEKISPYLGLGIGYFVNDFDSSISGISANLNNDFGFHLKTGSEFFIKENLALNLELTYIWNEAEGEINVIGNPILKGDIGLDTFKLGIGMKYFF